MDKKVQIKELKHKVLIALIERGVFSKDDNPRVTKFQGDVFHLKSDKDHGKAKFDGDEIVFDTAVFGFGRTKIIENRNSENPEVQKLVDEFGIDNEKMESTIFVYDREAGEIPQRRQTRERSISSEGERRLRVHRLDGLRRPAGRLCRSHPEGQT